MNCSNWFPVGAVLLLVATAGCRSFSPTPLDQLAFMERVQTETRGDLTVSVAVLSAEEAQQAFDVKMYKKKIQPVWVQVENRSEDFFFFLARSLDADYYSANEAAWKSHSSFSKAANRQMDDYFYDNQMGIDVPPGSVASGFVFASRDRGAKQVLVELLGEDRVERFEFLVEVPGFHADYQDVDVDALYGDQEIVDLDEQGLREWIEALPCCTTNADGSLNGDPLNIVLVGNEEAIWATFFRAEWDLTEAILTSSVIHTGLAGGAGTRYRYAPISPLYVFGRPQDIAWQKARHNIHERNHLRLWHAPVTFEGKPVLVGQISRDIGTRLTSRTWSFTTHKIDPDVDEARSSLIQDLFFSQALEAWAYAAGVGVAAREEPRQNLTGDPYFTDGLRAVLALTAEPTTMLEAEFFEWAAPR